MVTKILNSFDTRERSVAVRAADAIADINDEMYGRVFKALKEESDRGCILVGAAALDSSLGQLIRTHILLRCSASRENAKKREKVLEELFRPDAAFGTLSSRIKYAYTSGLLNDESYREIDGIRRIRNDFAHDFQRASFGPHEIRQRIGSLFCEGGYVPGRRKTARNVVIRCIAQNIGLLAGMRVGLIYGSACDERSA